MDLKVWDTSEDGENSVNIILFKEKISMFFFQVKLNLCL